MPTDSSICVPRETAFLQKPAFDAQLSGAQREIREIVWQYKEISASDVRDIPDRRREVARNTVRTLMERMEAARSKKSSSGDRK